MIAVLGLVAGTAVFFYQPVNRSGSQPERGMTAGEQNSRANANHSIEASMSGTARVTLTQADRQIHQEKVSAAENDIKAVMETYNNNLSDRTMRKKLENDMVKLMQEPEYKESISKLAFDALEKANRQHFDQ